MRKKHYKYNGLNFIEFAIAVVIIGVMTTVAYPSYQKFLINNRAMDAQLVIINLASAENIEWHQNGGYTLGIPPTDNDSDGWAEISDGHGCYAIGNNLVDLGKASSFEFKIENVSNRTFRIIARGNGDGLSESDQLILNYDEMAVPRTTWSASGKLSVPE